MDKNFALILWVLVLVPLLLAANWLFRGGLQLLTQTQ